MEPIIIDFPQFPEEIKLSEERRAKLFKKGDDLPKKYLALNELSKLANGYSWRKKNTGFCLYDDRQKQFVPKNSRAVGTPRYVSIAGNDIMRMFEHTRNKIVNTLKDYFLSKIGMSHGVGEDGRNLYGPVYQIPVFPVNISLEVHTFPHYMNWDLDNLWIYNKCFQDAMKECGMIPDDNIQYITAAAAPKFVPVSQEEDRLMRFTITEEEDVRIKYHILYWSKGKEFTAPLEAGYTTLFGCLPVDTDYHIGKPGDIMVETLESLPPQYRLKANIGLKKNVQVLKALERIRHQCYQLNCIPTFSKEDYERMQIGIENIFMKKGIPVKVI